MNFRTRLHEIDSWYKRFLFMVKVYLLLVICYKFMFNVNNFRKHDFLTVAL